MPMPPMKPMDESPAEETGEQDAVSAAFASIRASIDAAEQSLVKGRFQKPEEPAEPTEEGV